MRGLQDTVNVTGAIGGGRSTYRHGDLRRALVAAGVEMARSGGPAAVVLREATRRAGVAPNAAYRHFADRDALLGAVCDEAQAALARAIEQEQAQVPATPDPVAAARRRFHAVGAGYLRFARSEPGLFRTAFWVPSDLERRASPARAGTGGRTPYELLSAALDELVAAGVLPAARRPGAEFLAWSAVHGLATLLIDGPLRALDDAHVEQVAQRLLAMVDQGL